LNTGCLALPAYPCCQVEGMRLGPQAARKLFASTTNECIFFLYSIRASLVILYHKPESGKRWKDMNCGSDQQGKNLYSSFIYRLKPGFGRFFIGACNRFWNVLLQEDTQVWENDVLMITRL
jgi:hypothetical protein